MEGSFWNFVEKSGMAKTTSDSILGVIRKLELVLTRCAVLADKGNRCQCAIYGNAERRGIGGGLRSLIAFLVYLFIYLLIYWSVPLLIGLLCAIAACTDVTLRPMLCLRPRQLTSPRRSVAGPLLIKLRTEPTKQLNWNEMDSLYTLCEKTDLPVHSLCTGWAKNDPACFCQNFVKSPPTHRLAHS